MFTGIISEIGYIKNITHNAGKQYFVIETVDIHKDLQIGESIACNGICLTACEIKNNTITVEISDQTAKTTTATHWTQNTPIHLEKALTINQRLNGHVVQGHVDTTTTLKCRHTRHKTLYLTFDHPFCHAHLLVERGSICIDGVSLTAFDVRDYSFTVALIDYTLKNTHFERLRPGSLVNIEFDIIGKYVHKIMTIGFSETINGVPTHKQKHLFTEEWLIENVF